MSRFRKAVALHYPKDADAPYISAIGNNYMAEKIIEIAKDNNVPIVENSDMVNILSINSVGSIIPESTYDVIAKIFACITRLEADYD
ncbi:MAG: EscU/YscU/HrcU family type III secretion system export apparatus switch protein [Treponema sp.]|nr:EscU/YscU/HrcU family type III secretion system export apparatus switch protein [Treponema sp.]MBQ7881300.1 EscU/YscU/HrcU family type III secretion system export apparatus switch protein [Treponema sp.]